MKTSLLLTNLVKVAKFKHMVTYKQHFLDILFSKIKKSVFFCYVCTYLHYLNLYCIILTFSIDASIDSGPQNRWYYDSTDGTCKEFEYKGKKGNGNRFLTRQDCQASCQPSQVKVFVFFLVFFNGRLSEGWKWVSHLGILPHVQEQNNRQHSYFPRPGQSLHRGCSESNPAPGSTPSSNADPGRLEFSLPPEEPGCVHHTWLNPRLNADPL